METRIKKVEKENQELKKENKKQQNKYEKDMNKFIDELNQTKQELNEIQTKYEQTKQELKKCKSELNQTKDVSNGHKSDNKQYTQYIIVGGLDDYNQLGEKPNNKNRSQIIHPPVKLPLDPSSFLSYAVYGDHSVLVTSDGSLKGVGYNSDGRISATLQKTKIKDFTNFCIKDGSGRQLAAVSAVCCQYGTLYMFSKSSGNERQLVLCDCKIN